MGLIHWWPLQGDLNDHAGNIPLSSGTSSGSYSFPDTGKFGKCVALVNQNLNVANPFINLDNWSISFWFKNDGVNHWGDPICWSKNYSRLEISAADGSSWAWYRGNGSAADEDLTSGNVFGSPSVFISSGQKKDHWYNIIIVKKGTKSTFYLDGVSKLTYSSSASFTSNSDKMFFNTRGAISSNNGKMSLCDIRCYDHALSEAEMHELKSGLLIHYNFEDYMGQPYTTAYDGSGNELHGTITGVENRGDAATGKHSAYFPSTGSQYITIPNPPLNSKNISVSVWWKSSNTSPKGSYHILFATKSSSSSYSSIELSMPSNGQLRWGFVINNTRTTRNTTVSPKLNNGAWRHIVITYDGATEKAYVDGVQVGSVSTSGTITYTTSKDTYIGKYVSGSYGATDAYISDIRVYNTTLTQADVTSLYNHTVKVTPDQVMIGNYLVENNSDLNFQDLSVWKRTGHRERIRVLEDGVELAAVDGWRNFAVAVPSDMVGQNLIFSFDYKWNDNNRPYIGAWIWTNTSNSYTGSIYTLKYTIDDLPAGQWTHCSVPISAAKTYVGINNRVQDGSGMTAPLVLRNISLQLASNENVQVFPTGEVKCSRYGDSNKTRIIKAGNLTAETFVEI